MNNGFIALTMTLSVSGILLALVFASVIEDGLFFDQAIHKEYREMNYYFAYDCIDQAILTFAHDYFYKIQIPKEIPEFNCTILSIVESGNLRIIKARGDFQKAYVYRSATIKLNDQNLEVVKIE